MIIKSAQLETVCGITSKLPKNKLPEIAFAGKSNVGKSSLINALMNRKSLARTSAQPGKTQTINFYNINKEIYLVTGKAADLASRAAPRFPQLSELLAEIIHPDSFETEVPKYIGDEYRDYLTITKYLSYDN